MLIWVLNKTKICFFEIKYQLSFKWCVQFSPPYYVFPDLQKVSLTLIAPMDGLEVGRKEGGGGRGYRFNRVNPRLPDNCLGI